MKCTSHGGLQQLHLRSDGRNSRPTFAAGSLGKVGADRYGSVRRSRRYRKSRRLIRLSHIVQRIPLKFNDLPISLTITSSQNAVKTVKRRKPRRRIALWWGTFVLWNGENLDFMRFSGIEKVHRNSIKITVDLWWRRGESNSCPKTAPRNFLRAQSGVFYSRRRRRRTPHSSRYPFNL